MFLIIYWTFANHNKYCYKSRKDCIQMLGFFSKCIRYTCVLQIPCTTSYPLQTPRVLFRSNAAWHPKWTLHAAYNQLDKIQVKHRFVQHIKNTLTDRVAVSHCVVQALNTDLDIELLQLKCNVHPFDGIAKKCTDILNVYDE